MASDFYVGQKLWYSHPRHPREVEVVKVGRKWVYFGNERFDVASMRVDGGQYSSPGRVWLSRDACDQSRKRAIAWARLTRHLGSYSCRLSPDVTMDDMRAVVSLLRLDVRLEAPDGE